MKNTQLLKLVNSPLPAPTLDSFSYISTDKTVTEEWLNNLSMHNLAEISKQVRTTISELAMFRTDSATKLELLELIRPAVYNLISSLSKHYLSQTIVLDKKSASVASLVQVLRGYDFAINKHIALDLQQSGSAKKLNLGKLFKKTASKPALALHRAITALAGIINEANLLYLPSFEGTWQQLHSLFINAEQHNLLDEKVFDAQYSINQEETTIKEAYMRAVLINIFRTNSLRQQEILKLYNYSELWSKLLNESRNPSANDMFIIDLDSDLEPLNISTEQKLSNNLRYLNVNNIIQHLKQIQTNQSESLHPSETQLFRTSMIDYIIKSLEEPAERSTSRHPFEGQLIASLGLLSCHYYIADRTEFTDVIKLDDYLKEQQADNMLVNDFSQMGEGDLDFNNPNEQDKKQYYNIGKVNIVDISPGGYKVSWVGEGSSSLKTGELICVREDEQKPWQVGVIRWVQQKPTEGADIGIEVLAAKSTACGILPTGSNDDNASFMRALILPEIKSLNRPATLITPNYQFSPGHRIMIRRGKADAIAKLGNQYLKTQSFNQYDFTVLPPKKVIKTDTNLL